MATSEWNEEHQRHLYTEWVPEHQCFQRKHYVEGQGWVHFDWLPAQGQSARADSPQQARAGPVSHPGPVIAGTYDFNRPVPNSHVEPLDPTYYVRDSGFFVPGKVFSVLFSEGAGSTATPYNDSFSRVKYDELVFSQIRRFIVVGRRHGFCYAVPIFTYNNQATKKRGIDPDAHAIAYSMGYSPALLEGERPLEKQPICIVMAQDVPPLSAASRIFFGIHHPIQHNVKVKDIGQVHPDHIHSLLGYWNTENFASGY